LHKAASAAPNVRFGSTPVIENSEPNFRKGVESGYSIKPPDVASAPLAEVEGLAALLVSSSATDRLDDVAD
jgi:hypothetical protein